MVVDDKRFTASCPVSTAGPSTATDLVTRSGAAPDVLARPPAAYFRIQPTSSTPHNRATVTPDIGLTDSQVEAIIEALRAD